MYFIGKITGYLRGDILSKNLLILILILASYSVCAGKADFIISKHYYLIDDDNVNYSLPVKNRVAWQKKTFNGIKSSKKIRWVQIDFDLEKQFQDPLGVYVSILGSFEAYWDGVLIGQNGRVGDSLDSEVAGSIDKTMLIPSELSGKGVHTLSLRMSNQHSPNDLTHVSFSAVIAQYDHLIQLPFKQSSLPLIMTSALFLIALYSLFIFITSYRELSYLLFSMLCLSILLLIFAESWRGIISYSYDWQIPRLQIVLALSLLTSLLFTCFFAWFFKLPQKYRIAWLVLVISSQGMLLITISGYDNRSLYTFLVGIIGAVGICVQAILTHQANAKLMLIGLGLFIAPIFINSYSYMDQYFFLSFAGLILLMLYTLAQTMGVNTKLLEKSKVNASRLELELVKRNLQPHFILNTLTAVEEWIEDSPTTAVKFIHALADEFRFMAQLSAKKTINVRDEISLCQSHLRVMGYRSNIEYMLSNQISNVNALIPPGIILTLIENAISHNHYQQGQTTFILEQKITNTTQCLTFMAPANGSEKQCSITVNASNNIGAGIGNKYIAARLDESFINKWSMKEYFENNHWITIIIIPFAINDSHLTSHAITKDT
ncbi:histidine kinase [Thalassotalea sp. 1_MG-2023]|uniref:histidine kinase n=1 Tax=Thalassotalea sp. 1_MG-2023 TaxID=3062680 RepID=UPI0026E1197D|nr:histidine kinase [Thalassotalea sp. 1_MG-2023]MDO6427682.1 histidine kinase [Thalassotalea sp. 1_MG-2023]